MGKLLTNSVIAKEFYVQTAAAASFVDQLLIELEPPLIISPFQLMIKCVFPVQAGKDKRFLLDKLRKLQRTQNPFAPRGQDQQVSLVAQIPLFQ